MKAEEEEQKKKEAQETFGWQENKNENEVTQNQPKMATLNACDLKEPAIHYQAKYDANGEDQISVDLGTN